MTDRMTTTDNKALAERLIDQARWFEHQADVEREPETKASHRECARDCREAAVALREPSTPSAHDYVPGELDRTAPARIWLQIDTSGDNAERDEPWPGADHVTWQDESIGGLEIQYVRADLATPSAQADKARGEVGYFAADPAEGEFNVFRTLEEAKAGADELLDWASDAAADSGWADDPPQICYGVILGRCVEESREPAPEGSDFDELVIFRVESTTPQPQGDASPSAHSIDAMVDRFLAWPVPKDFAPDAGIQFAPSEHPNGWPVGTNLLTAAQAKAMFEHVLAGTPSAQVSSGGDLDADDRRHIERAIRVLHRDYEAPLSSAVKRMYAAALSAPQARPDGGEAHLDPAAFFWLGSVLTTYGDKLSPSAMAIIAGRIAHPTPAPDAVARPKARDVGRIGDMDRAAALRVGFDGDGDVYLSTPAGGEGVEFCTTGSGGGKSPRTRDALIALMVAMEADNAEDPRRDWWARRNGTFTAAQQEAGRG